VALFLVWKFIFDKSKLDFDSTVSFGPSIAMIVLCFLMKTWDFRFTHQVYTIYSIGLRGQDSGQGKSAAHGTIGQACAKNPDVPAHSAKIIGACATHCTSTHGCLSIRAYAHLFPEFHSCFALLRDQTWIFGMVEVVKRA
jgi:hypothetical protein